MRLIKHLTLSGMLVISASAFADIDLTIDPAFIDYGSVTVGETASENATIGITFDGNGDLNGNANNGSITSISIVNAVGSATFAAAQDCVGTDFSANSPDAVCVVQVDCTTSAIESSLADLEVQLQRQNGAAPDIQTIPLSCAGAAPSMPGPAATPIPTLSALGLGLLVLLIGGLGFWSRRWA